jgi:predicted transcriptional regulator
MGSRSRAEIVSHILESAANGEGATKTKIMYTASLIMCN